MCILTKAVTSLLIYWTCVRMNDYEREIKGKRAKKCMKITYFKLGRCMRSRLRIRYGNLFSTKPITLTKYIYITVF